MNSDKQTHRAGKLSNLYPRRIFIDSCTIQTLRKYGEFIYDGGPLCSDHLASSTIENILAIRAICEVTARANFQWVVSKDSRKEAEAKHDSKHLGWYDEIANYSAAFLDSTTITPTLFELSKKLDEPKFGYLASGDRALLKDAVLLGCDSFLTMETKLPKNGAHFFREIGVQILTPLSYWQLLRPWAALW